jgi:membrane protease YdiL (CAAX protease family)
MPAAPDLPAVLLSLLFLGVLASSLALWLARWLAPRNPIQVHEPLPPWSIGWINFGIFLCTLTVGLYLFQILGFAILTRIGLIASEIPDPLTARFALVSILLLQLPVLFIILGLRHFYPGHFAGAFESHVLPWLKAARLAAPYFLRYIPVIWIASLLWNFALMGLRSIGIIEDTPPQELVELFSLGENPLLLAGIALSAVLLAPFVEELLFRGCIYRFLKSQTFIPFAQFISGALFALVHGNLASFGPLVVVGILLAHLYEKERSLRVAICFHAFFNAFSLSLILLAAKSEVVPLP